MPRAQCPECGRFLKAALVAGLAEAPAPCPGCGVELRSQQFAADEPAEPAASPDPAEPADSEAVPAGASAGHASGEGSVRPPDLPPQTVRDAASDVLAGWDTGVGPDEFAAWNDDRAPFPTDAAVVIGAGAVGLLVGLAVARDRRLSGAAAGAVIGAVAAAAARQVWRLDT